ncbi:MAG: TRIC cation channel family protein [Hyphomonadaceae bacterium]|nr:TRIC cation channel family protein [Hyphomonadaceae bacterium]
MDLALFSLIGTAVFAASGALAADQERFDIVGALFLSVAAGLGGGTIVDLLIGHAPVRWVADPAPLWIAAGAGTASFLALRVARPPLRLLDWADAAGLAVFTASGMERLTTLDLGPGVAVVLTAIGACGGGIVRDVIANRAPLVFSGELYVTAALIGAAAFLVADAAAAGAGLFTALLVTAIVRGAGLVFGLRLIHGRG